MRDGLAFSPRDARAIVRYNRAVFDRFVGRVRKLPRSEATRPRGIGHESLFDTLVHILHVQEAWLVYLVPGRRKELLAVLRDPAYRQPKTWREFDRYAARVWTDVEATVRGLTPRGLSAPVRAPWMPGVYTARDAILQTTLEEAHHLGEIIGALWQDDRAPPDMTWMDLERSVRRRAR
jgi:uncharacterized damage-inducible protein DinB